MASRAIEWWAMTAEGTPVDPLGASDPERPVKMSMGRPAEPKGGNGRVLIEDATGVAEVIEELRGVDRYGIDTEFHRERTYWPKLALVQIAWEGGLVLLDPLRTDLAGLAEIFDGPGLAIAHAADQDLEVLSRVTGTIPARLFDTQIAAGFLGMSSPSLVNLVEALLGRRLSKGDRLTDWTMRPLTAAQLSYAAADVEHLLELHTEMASRLEDLGRLSWAEGECELARQKGRRQGLEERAWWRLKDARQLRGEARGVAQEVAAWRERRAAAVDRPVRHVLPDLAISAIAHRVPLSVSDLAKVRGMDGRLPAGAVGAEIVAAAQRGKMLKEDELHLPPSDSLDRRMKPAATLAGAWISQRASELSIDATMLATRTDLYAFIRGDQGRLAEGWRKEVLGELLGEVLSGRVALVLDGQGGLLLEERSHHPFVPGHP